MDVIGDLFTEESLRAMADSEQSYRRGVSQALALAAQYVRDGATADDMDLLADEAEVMRWDREGAPAFLDTLRERYGKRRAKGAERWN